MLLTATILGVLQHAEAAQTTAYSAAGSNSNMRAGPSFDTPQIARLAPDTRIHIIRCLETTWCEADVGGLRGWIHGSRLRFPLNAAPPSSVPLAPELRHQATPEGGCPDYPPSYKGLRC